MSLAYAFTSVNLVLTVSLFLPSCTSLLLIAESRIALAAVNDEMDFVLRLSRHRAPAELWHHQDMNTLTPEMHSNSDFTELFNAVERKMAE